jgi:2-isopropylmalate synthase
MKTEHKLDLPRRLQIEFSRVVQQHTDVAGGEVSADEYGRIFSAEYLDSTDPLRLNSVHTSSAAGERDALTVTSTSTASARRSRGEGNGPIAAFVDALSVVGIDVRVLDYAEHALSSGGDARAAAYVECAVAGSVVWGVGVDPNIVTASLKAVLSAANRGM